MNPFEVAALQTAAGWSVADATVATAVVLRSSGGNPGAPGGLYGIGTTGPAIAQAQEAKTRQARDGWGVFPAYADRSYLLFMPAATAAVTAAAAAAPVASAGSATVDAAQSVGQVAGWLTQPEAWQRTVKVIAGLLLITLGGIMLANRTARATVIKPLQGVARGADRVAAETEAVRTATPLTQSR